MLDDAATKRRRTAVGAGAIALVSLACIAAVLALPGCICRRAVAMAAERGVALTVGTVRLGAGHVSLVDVTATAHRVPTATLHADDVEIVLSGLSPSRVTAHGAEIAVRGPLRTILAQLADFRAEATRASRPSLPLDITLESTRLAWSDPADGVSQLDALELRVDAHAGDLHVRSPRVTLQTARGLVGPWRARFDRESASTRAHVAFDPALDDGPNLVVTGSDDRVTTLQLTVARTTLAALGLHASVLGLTGATDATPIEANARYEWHTRTQADARATVALFGLRFTRGSPLDAHLDFVGDGDPSVGLVIRHGALRLGPLAGAVVGSLRAEPPLRLELRASTRPVPCAAFLEPPALANGADPAARAVNEIAGEATKLAQALGLATITGEYRADATVVVDLADPDRSHATFTPHSSCEALLFGQ